MKKTKEIKRPINFAIGIPTLNRIDLLGPAVRKYQIFYRGIDIVIVDNGDQIKGAAPWDCQGSLRYIRLAENLGVAGSWNRLLKTIFDDEEKTHALILNDDIELCMTPYMLAEWLRVQTGRLFITLKDWSAFVIPRATWQDVGEFDEGFYPAYYEDSDYAYRMKLSGGGLVRSPQLSPQVYRDNSTAAKDPSIRVAAQKNRERYIQKWGGLPGQEKFIKPFNKK
jgi:GT2 family glycosyltransferase